MSYLVANPEDRFSRDEAQLLVGLKTQTPSQILLFFKKVSNFYVDVTQQAIQTLMHMSYVMR